MRQGHEISAKGDGVVVILKERSDRAPCSGRRPGFTSTTSVVDRVEIG
jgi:hypothetical protein